MVRFVNLNSSVNTLVRHNITTARVLLLLVVLFAVITGLVNFGCVRGLQPIGWSGATIAGDTLFVGSREGRLVAISIAGGSPRWSDSIQTSAPTSILGCSACAAGQAGVPIYGTPAVAGDLVYIGGYNGKIYAFNSTSLTVRWVYPREGSLRPFVGGPVVALDKVFIAGAEGDNAHGMIYALDAETGDLEWEFETEDKIWSTPVIDANTLYVGSFDKKLYAINADTGEASWDEPFEAEGAIVSTPLVHNNMVYFGAFDRHIYALDKSNGSLRWRSEVDAGNWFWASPLVHEGVVYAGCLDGKVYIFDAEDGYEIRDALSVESPISSSPVLVNGSIIIATQEGSIFILDADGNDFNQLANIESEIYSPIYIYEGIIYIHTQDLTLHRVDVNTGAQLANISLESSE